ncbi:hypothetical protein N7448_000569 [Penicillium atrosanguineum]|uniref:Uncharacterized protein n=1 Tax=Penicillium atrosanguineum TaxID=1132637 RepID=A0A9W9HHX3_9EURO|nr:H/ACA ribonucleoprotein complex subunit [Penicillium atrosanguineum]KAJ5134409.1 hypothetical protein N7526_005774 [Penicillium atrosanguineum]KAJ5148991.1 hypothetical protein N7448_000569 [Penicillium atrosanguineum]KAJ5304307.1 H/ACA ribonucleoprotein complex subunit [Penicillium atrosanguineum]KAJ5323782.1 hypothetical protein N7476_002382 [Penicillium atrosanguineum]
MGGWAISCAICGGPFSSQVNVDPERTEEDCYRDEFLEDLDLGWLDELCALGINPDAPGNDTSVTVASYSTTK